MGFRVLGFRVQGSTWRFMGTSRQGHKKGNAGSSIVEEVPMNLQVGVQGLGDHQAYGDLSGFRVQGSGMPFALGHAGLCRAASGSQR